MVMRNEQWTRDGLKAKGFQFFTTFGFCEVFVTPEDMIFWNPTTLRIETALKRTDYLNSKDPFTEDDE